jgi:hypothetical protein
MQSPHDFIQSYLCEKKDLERLSCQHGMVLHQKFYAEEYSKSLQDWHAARDKNPESIVSAEVSDTSAKVITIEPLGRNKQRYRYLLRLSGLDWKIYGREWECFVCHGTGREGKVECHLCGGVGWTGPGP